MPLTLPADLPAAARLAAEGCAVLPDTGGRDDGLRLVLLNLMADAALEATERQFWRLAALGAPELDLRGGLCSLPGLPRGTAARRHLERHYRSWPDVRSAGLDALIITGLNVEGPDLTGQVFWEPLVEVLEWARRRGVPTLCSCLATHAVVQLRSGRRRRPLPAKKWGVFPHTATDPQHPLTAGLPARFDVPHSRYNDVPAEAFAAAGLQVLATDAAGGVHLAATPGFPALVCWQGHPEYDAVSLLKEYRRELERQRAGERADQPPLPEGLLDGAARERLTAYLARREAAHAAGGPTPVFPEADLAAGIRPLWREPAARVLGNWLRQVAGRTSVG